MRLVPDAYRSYMVRVRRRGVAPDSVRIDVEDLIGGGRTQLTGGAASELAAGLAAAIGSDVIPGDEPSRNDGAASATAADVKVEES
jgi:hypothetical protein